MHSSALSLDIRRIITDSDLDGVVTAAILKRHWPHAEVIFGHPGELRAGVLDGLIDNFTAICDLPRHSKCGLNIDHHQSNKPRDNLNFDGIVIWENSPSAARIAYDLLHEAVDLEDLTELLLWVDKIDSGQITKDEYLSEEPVLLLGKIIGIDLDINLHILTAVKNGESVESILSKEELVPYLIEIQDNKIGIEDIIEKTMEIVNRLAIVRFEGSGVRSNGYHVTAKAGGDCDACIIIHGDIGGTFTEEGGYPVSASFYTNSFLHNEGGIYDLTQMAKRFDPDGGGHSNACGCRIKPIKNGIIENRDLNVSDIEKNIYEWISMWNDK